MPDPDPVAPRQRCLLDTNIFSYLLRGDTRAEPCRAYLAGRQLGVSFQTVAELRRWAIERRWGSVRRRELARRLDRVVVYLVDDALMTAWAEITARLRPAGRPITDSDAWIAATAWTLDIPLVTHNRRHFEAIDGPLVSANSGGLRQRCLGGGRSGLGPALAPGPGGQVRGDGRFLAHPRRRGKSRGNGVRASRRRRRPGVGCGRRSQKPVGTAGAVAAA